MKSLCSVLAISLLLLLAGCATTAGSSQAPPLDPDANAVSSYHIGVDDQLQVTVWHNPDLSVSVPVRPDGKITVPLIGDVEAGGRTPEEVASVIRQKLQAFVRDPQVAVILTQLRSHEYLSRVRVTGAVRTPVSLPYRQGMTVLDAVLAAGGTTEYAAPDRVGQHVGRVVAREAEALRAPALRGVEPAGRRRDVPEPARAVEHQHGRRVGARCGDVRTGKRAPHGLQEIVRGSAVVVHA